MKKIIILLTSLFVVIFSACSAEQTYKNTTLDIFEHAKDKMYVVAYLGFEQEMATHRLKTYNEVFLNEEEIPIYEISQGEYYLIIPKENVRNTKIYKNDIFGQNKDLMFEFDGNSPFVVCGNYSEVFSEIFIEITTDTETMKFEPAISLKDGSVMAGERGFGIDNINKLIYTKEEITMIDDILSRYVEHGVRFENELLWFDYYSPITKEKIGYMCILRGTTTKNMGIYLSDTYSAYVDYVGSQDRVIVNTRSNMNSKFDYCFLPKIDVEKYGKTNASFHFDTSGVGTLLFFAPDGILQFTSTDNGANWKQTKKYKIKNLFNEEEQIVPFDLVTFDDTKYISGNFGSNIMLKKSISDKKFTDVTVLDKTGYVDKIIYFDSNIGIVSVNNTENDYTNYYITTDDGISWRVWETV